MQILQKELHSTKRINRKKKLTKKMNTYNEKRPVQVDRWFPSSKTCSHCGHIHKKLRLSDRIYLCPKCGHTMDRDQQAAQNIVKEAKRMLLNAAF